MDDFERTLGERLRAEADMVYPPPELAGRIHERVASRRRRRRLAEAAGVAAAVTALVAVPAAVHLNERPDHSPKLAATTARPGIRLNMDHLGAIPRRLPGGKVFVPLSIGENGSVVGEGVSSDGSVDGRVWRSGAGGGAAKAVAKSSGLWAARTDGDRIVWPQTTDGAHDYELMCADSGPGWPPRGPVPRQLGTGGVTATENAFAADRGAVVWSDERDPPTVWMARSCVGPAQRLYRGGSAIAFSYPDVLVAQVRNGRFNGRLTRVDVLSGTDMPPALMDRAVDLTGREGATFTANAQVLAWAEDGRLTMIDRASGRTTSTRVRLPDDTGRGGEIARLTAGNKVLVFSTRPQNGDPAAAGSMVYDLRTGTSFALRGESYAAGDWLLWRDGESYRLGHVR